MSDLAVRGNIHKVFIRDKAGRQWTLPYSVHKRNRATVKRKKVRSRDTPISVLFLSIMIQSTKLVIIFHCLQLFYNGSAKTISFSFLV